MTEKVSKKLLDFLLPVAGATSAIPTVTSLPNWTSQELRTFLRRSLVIRIVRRLWSHQGSAMEILRMILTVPKLFCSGLAAVWQNKRTGLFQFLGEHNGRPVFVVIEFLDFPKPQISIFHFVAYNTWSLSTSSLLSLIFSSVSAQCNKGVSVLHIHFHFLANFQLF